MAVVDWPTGVPSCIEPTSPQGGLIDNRVSFGTDSKFPPIERPVSSWAPELYSVVMVPFSVDQFILFQNWYKNDLSYGVLPFRWFHPITKQPSAWKIMRGDPPFQVRKTGAIPLGSGRRRISVSFSVMSWPESFGPMFLGQENSDDVNQENGDRIIVSEGFVFVGT
jgi:hypothetical protein